MSYIALYREWRPQTFTDMVGQEHVTRTLQNALRTNRFAHAYLFSGPRGTGKTSTAKIFAKAINCEKGPAVEPCNECAACHGITKGSIMDVVEIDAASNRGVDEIRDLREQVKYASTEVRYKVYIVDEVHMLTTEAFNALLKTLEEPPQHVVFILATTEPHKLPATIISRCQRFDFRRITGRQIVERLRYIAQEIQVQVEEEALWMIARAAEGGMRDALSIFDQVISFSGDHVTIDAIITLTGGVRADILSSIAHSIADKHIQRVLKVTNYLIEEGKDAGKIIYDLIVYFRDLLMYKTVPDLEEIQDRIQYEKQFSETANLFSPTQLIDMIDQMTTCSQEMKWHTQSRLLLEMCLIRLCKTESNDVKDLIRRIEELERKMAEGVSSPLTAVYTQPSIGQTSQKPVKQQRNVNEHRTAENQKSDKPSKVAPPAKQLDNLLKHPSKEQFNKISSGWNQILDEVKRRKITAQAWLLDGEAVAVDSGKVIVAFKNQIHRDTVMKPIHKSVIDEVVTEFLGEPSSLVAILQTEWQKYKQQSAEELAATTTEDDLAKEVIQFFGKEIVEIEE